MRRCGYFGRLALIAALVIIVAVNYGCAGAKGPKVLIEPTPPIPAYAWTDGPNGGACLDSAGLAALDQELEILYSRAEYLHNLLTDLGATDAPTPAP